MNIELTNKLNSIDWDAILPALYAYAYARFKYPCLQTTMSPNDLVNEAIKRVLCGERIWDYKNYPDFVIFMKMVIKSIASHSLEKVKAEKQCNDDAMQDHMLRYENQDIDDETNESYKVALAEIENRLIKDDDLLLMFYAMQEGHFSDIDLSQALDIEVQDIRNMKKRMRRHLADIGEKLGIK